MGILRFSLIAFFLILLIKKKFDLGLSLMLCSLFLGLMYLSGPAGIDVLDIGEVFLQSVISPLGILMLTAVMMIIYLSELMKTAGRISLLVSSLRTMLGDPRGVVTLIPAMIGLLPIIGGAMISAPMVEEASEELKLGPTKKTFLNYWFRHLWEYIFPTYPGVIFSAAILGITYRDVAVANLPLSLAAVAGGLYFGVKGISYKTSGDGRITFKLLSDFFISALPLIVVITSVLFIDPRWIIPKALNIPADSKLPALLLLNSSLLIVFFISAIIYRIGPRDILTIVKANFSMRFVSIVIGIVFFWNILMATHAVNEISKDLFALNVPIFLVLVILPFIIGISTGITVAFVGITFPILLPFFSVGDYPMIAFMLAYAGGYAGVMLSPVHLCLVLTTEYFKADLGEVYKLVVRPVACVLAMALGIYLLFFYIL